MKIFKFYILVFTALQIFNSCHSKISTNKILLINISNISCSDLLDFIKQIQNKHPKVISIYGAFKFNNDSLFFNTIKEYNNVISHIYLEDSMRDIDYFNTYPFLSPKTHGITQIPYLSDTNQCFKYFKKINNDNFLHYLALHSFKFDSIKTLDYFNYNNNMLCFNYKEVPFHNSVIYQYDEFVKMNLELNDCLLYLSNFDSTIEKGQISDQNFYDFLVIQKTSEILGINY